MPCQSYDTNWADNSNDRDVRRLKEEADKLARIACRALEELERNGIEDMLLLKDDETREWWAKHKEADRKARAIIEERKRRERVKQEALAKLSAEEREVLGIASPKRHRKFTSDKLIDDLIDRLNNPEDDIPF
jgi:predicted ribonuclease YlaK